MANFLEVNPEIPGSSQAFEFSLISPRTVNNFTRMSDLSVSYRRPGESAIPY